MFCSTTMAFVAFNMRKHNRWTFLVVLWTLYTFLKISVKECLRFSRQKMILTEGNFNIKTSIGTYAMSKIMPNELFFTGSSIMMNELVFVEAVQMHLDIHTFKPHFLAWFLIFFQFVPKLISFQFLANCFYLFMTFYEVFETRVGACLNTSKSNKIDWAQLLFEWYKKTHLTCLFNCLYILLPQTSILGLL